MLQATLGPVVEKVDNNIINALNSKTTYFFYGIPGTI